MQKKQNRFWKTVILIGPPDCGKTTLGELAAQKLGAPFMDTDREIAKKFNERYPEGGSLLELLHCFQDLEWEVLRERICEEKPFILSTGGETALSPKNALILKTLGYIILIRRDKETLKEELVREKRPRWVMVADNGEETNGLFTDMYFKEMTHYELIADAVLENDFGIEKGLEALLDLINAIPE